MNTTFLPDGTSPDNQGIADLAIESRQIAFNEGRATFLDLLLEEVMRTSATVEPDELIKQLDEVVHVAESWQGAITARRAEPVVAE